MKAQIDNDLLEAFALSFSQHDDLSYVGERPIPNQLLDSTLTDDWGIDRWRPAGLPKPRAGIEGMRLGGRLPYLFELFVESYSWLEVELPVCRLFANPPSGDFVDLANAMFSDPVLNNTLLPQHFV